MASRSVASALTLLTSEGYDFMLSDSPDNNRLEALVKEYFTGNDDITDCESSDSDAEGFPNINVFGFIISYRRSHAQRFTTVLFRGRLH